MFTKSFRGFSLVLIAALLLSWSYVPAYSKPQASTDETLRGIDAPTGSAATIFTQPILPNGILYQSSFLDPDGSNNDKCVWDNFTLPATASITEIDWFGGYDPLKWGAGGPVLDFNVKIYPSIPAGTEPAIAYPPLVQYQTGGNASQTSIGTIGGIPMYSYAFILPAPFVASAGVKYWVQIEAVQTGSNPDWGIAAGSGGEGSHYLKESGAGGDVRYHSVPGDTAFSLSDTIPGSPTDISLSNDMVDENLPANTLVGALAATSPDPNATFTFSLTCTNAGVDDGSFNILGSEVRTSAIFDFETQSIYDICIRVTDQGGLFFDKNFIISVNNINEWPPVCQAINLTVNQNTTGQTNPVCSDGDGNSLTYAIVTQPVHGTAAIVAGKLSYTPATNYHGSDNFTYTANDGAFDGNTAGVAVTINPVSNPLVGVWLPLIIK